MANQKDTETMFEPKKKPKVKEKVSSLSPSLSPLPAPPVGHLPSSTPWKQKFQQKVRSRKLRRRKQKGHFSNNITALNSSPIIVRDDQCLSKKSSEELSLYFFPDFRAGQMAVTKMLEVVVGFVKALTRDIICVLLYIKFQVQYHKSALFRENLITKFDAIADRYPEKPAILYKNESLTFSELQDLSYRVANWLEQTTKVGLSQEYVSKIDDSVFEPEQSQVGLMLGNIPEMPGFLLGIARIRACSVLFNINQKKDTLVNAFRATKCRIVIYERRFLESLREISRELDPSIVFVMYDRENLEPLDSNNNELSNGNILKTGIANFRGVSGKELAENQVNFALVLRQFPAEPPRKTYRYSLHDHIGYIFTSGTTGGNIKATPIDNVRYIVGFLSQSNAFGINQSDNVYIPLPLFHSFPGVIGLGRCLLGGSTITLADKFSASGFWSDCVKHQCTVALYIGETCRYLLAQPVRPEEKEHKVRMVCGLGMRREIWKEFQERFNVKKIAEFYGSSEGNINLFNMCNIEGSCGFIPYYFGPLQRFLFPIYLIHIDPVTLEPIRAKNGLCTLATPGQTALIVGQIKDHLPYTKFLGYTAGQEESSKKVLTDILSFGDYAFSSGDLMEMDLYGNLYFRDRTGDTFRYKGENVSTTEIEEIAAAVLPKKCVFTCYGIEVPNCEGRIGMLAIERPLTGSIDLGALYKHLSERLPEYACPKFVRFTKKIETTSTHKLIKYRLREAGFRNDVPEFGGDDIYYFDKACKQFLPLRPEVEDKLWLNF